MPGIAGIISRSGGAAEDAGRMARMLAHQPFEVMGAYSNNALGAHVGWAVHPGSYADGGPFWNRDRTACLVFSGENFFDGPGAGQRSAQEIVERYASEGPAVLEKLNGWFCGLLLDIERKQAMLFNDRYGMGRLYIHESNDRFYFSSQAKSLLAVLPQLREFDLRGAAETVSCGAVLQNRSLFRGVSLLPCAAKWSFHGDGTIRKDAYFTPATWEAQSTLDRETFYQSLKETIARVTPKYAAGERPRAMSLTGGLDGRMVMAWLGAAPGSLPCYTFGGPYRDCADVTIGRRVAQQCQQPHTVIRIGNDFHDHFAQLAEQTILVSDGAMDVTGAVELYANSLARQIAPIRLTGNYGSEIVRGNVAFRPGKVARELYAPDFLRLIDDAEESYKAERNVPLMSFIAFKQAPWHHFARLSIEQSELTLRSPFLDNDLVKLMYRAPLDAIESPDLSLRLIQQGNPSLAQIPTDRGLVYEDATLSRKLIHKLIEFSFKAEYAYDYGMPQWLAQIDGRLSLLHLERLFLGHHKFYHFRVWYRDQLSRYVKDTLLDPRALRRGYLNGPVLERMVQEHVSGRGNWTREITRALSLELTQRLLIEK